MRTTTDSKAQRFLTPRQLADRWMVSVQKLRRMRRHGTLAVHYFGRSARYALADIERIERDARA